MDKKKIPFKTCDNCVWWQEHSNLPWKEFTEAYKIQFPEGFRLLLEDEEKYFKSPGRQRCFPSPGDELKQYKGQWFKPNLSKCPFDYKPNLKIALRVINPFFNLKN